MLVRFDVDLRSAGYALFLGGLVLIGIITLAKEVADARGRPLQLNKALYDSYVETYLPDGYLDLFTGQHLLAEPLPRVETLEDRLPKGLTLESFGQAGHYEEPSRTVFMLRSDTSFPYTDLFSVQETAMQVCDRDTSLPGCTVRLNHNYAAHQQGAKLIELLKTFCVSANKSDIYVKVADNTIIPYAEMDKLVRAVHHSSCNYAGEVNRDYDFYYADDRLYVFTKEMLLRTCENIPDFRVSHFSDAVTFGQLLNATGDDVCEVKGINYWYNEYSDQRVSISFVDETDNASDDLEDNESLQDI